MASSKTKARQFVSADPGKCTGCSICEYVCILEKGESPWNPLKSRIRVTRLTPLFNAVMTCRFCEDAPCVKACSRKALIQSQANGTILVEESKCDACGWCIQACPYGGITIHPDTRVVVACDLCEGEPKCVEFCPEEALELIPDDEAAEKIWVTAIEKIPLEIERLANVLKKREWTTVFAEAEKRAKKLTERLEALNKRRRLGKL